MHVGGKVTLWGMIDARTITFPVEAEDFNAAVARYPVPADRARELVCGCGFDVVEARPGTATLIISAIDFRRHQWGSFRAVSFALLARPTGQPDAPVCPFVLQSPVDKRLSFEAGHRAQRLVRTLERIDVGYDDRDVTFALMVEGEPTMALHVPRVAPAATPARSSSWVYTAVDGVRYRTAVDFAMGTGDVEPARVGLTLGTSPLADTLRALGLPHPPDGCSWGEGLSASYEMAEELPGLP
ncbi:MAG TPA: hypothetical protein VF743_13005 [Acidimicrobiales bacterium]